MLVRALQCMRRPRTIFRIDEKNSAMLDGLIGNPANDHQGSNFLLPYVTRTMRDANIKRDLPAIDLGLDETIRRCRPCRRPVSHEKRRKLQLPYRATAERSHGEFLEGGGLSLRPVAFRACTERIARSGEAASRTRPDSRHAGRRIEFLRFARGTRVHFGNDQAEHDANTSNLPAKISGAPKKGAMIFPIRTPRLGERMQASPTGQFGGRFDYGP